MVPLEPESPPDLHGKRIFMGAGQRDPLISPQETERLAGMLRGYGATVEESWQPGGHSLTRGEVIAARDWLHGQQW
jgi:predicted esterase